MDRPTMEARTKQFALRVLRLCRALPGNIEGDVIRRQLVKSGTSVGANYRAAGRAKSRKDFANKLGIVEEEADETCFWLELIVETELLNPDQVRPLLVEAEEIVRIVASSRQKARRDPDPSE